MVADRLDKALNVLTDRILAPKRLKPGDMAAAHIEVKDALVTLVREASKHGDQDLAKQLRLQQKLVQQLRSTLGELVTAVDEGTPGAIQRAVSLAKAVLLR